jgi:hypothetical protein
MFLYISGKANYTIYRPKENLFCGKLNQILPTRYSIASQLATFLWQARTLKDRTGPASGVLHLPGWTGFHSIVQDVKCQQNNVSSTGKIA